MFFKPWLDRAVGESESVTAMPDLARVAFTCRRDRNRPALPNVVKPIRHDTFYQPNHCGDPGGRLACGCLAG